MGTCIRLRRSGWRRGDSREQAVEVIECGLEHFTSFGSAVKTEQRLGLERSRSYVVWKARASR